jgi:hypothetical protein
VGNLLILIIVGLAGYVAYRFLLQRTEEKLRDNPPERRVI